MLEKLGTWPGTGLGVTLRFRIAVVLSVIITLSQIYLFYNLRGIYESVGFFLVTILIMYVIVTLAGALPRLIRKN